MHFIKVFKYACGMNTTIRFSSTIVQLNLLLIPKPGNCSHTVCFFCIVLILMLDQHIKLSYTQHLSYYCLWSWHRHVVVLLLLLLFQGRDHTQVEKLTLDSRIVPTGPIRAFTRTIIICDKTTERTRNKQGQ